MMGEVKKGNGGVGIEGKGRCRYMRGVGWMVGGREDLVEEMAP